MQQEHDSQQTADLCTNGCGFFGSQATGGMCSVCWKKTMSKNSNANNNVQVPIPVQVPAPVNKSEEEKDNHISTSTIVEKTEEEINVETKEEVPSNSNIPVQKNRKRCMQCNKKVGLTGIECRCGFIYCGLHRYADQHECTFDYKTADRKELAKRNPGGGLFNKMDKL